jgi:2-succinyl-5-enolpyruvyl-6-hydroxy-3-cyclohexene-1-carboxylate synthase
MPLFPKNEIARLIVENCKNYKIDTVVISPGSRSAPLIIGFNESDEFKTLSIVDERCAAFFAIGIAQQTRQPVVLVCTSGSALLNYYPAIAEAYYSNIPLIVISADRPGHLIDVGDGQTIRQENIFENHILYSANLSNKDSVTAAERITTALKKAINDSGPVHINVPFDEPLYETIMVDPKEIEGIENEELSMLNETPIEIEELQKYADIWNSSTKKIVLVGEHYPDELLQIQLEHLIKDPSVLILIENTANVSHSKFINSIDKLIFPFVENELEQFRPEILLSLGGLIVSKKIKQHLRKYQPKHHWHIDVKRAFDTFHCLEHHFKVSAQLFFSQFFFLTKTTESNYQNFWLGKKAFRLKRHREFLDNCPFSDLKVFQLMLDAVPNNSQLQLGNSSVIRYSQLFDINDTLRVFCNRGTSGIDGSTSTAIGAAYAVKENTVFITGDISFFYDSNALWNSYIRPDFRIIVVNNGGGGIFRFIPGPKESNALDYFETPHNFTAEHLCKMYNFEYNSAMTEKEMEERFFDFYKESKYPKLLEIFTPREENDQILKAYFNNLKE